MRRRTLGSRQLTFPPRPISRVSSASLPAYAACHTASPIESLIASAALYRPSPARTPAHSEGRARLRCDAREAAARTPSQCACSAPTRPSELGWPRRPWREDASRTLAATTARSQGCRNAWLPRPRAAWCGRAKQRAAPSSVVWACEAAGEAGHRARPRGFSERTSTPHQGDFPSTLGTPVKRFCKNCEVPVALRHYQVPDVAIHEREQHCFPGGECARLF
jgi:hypothetical protein